MLIRQTRSRGPEKAEFNDSRAPKLRPKWRGPFEVVAIISEVSLKIVEPIRKRRARKVHINNVKPYFSLPPNWDVKLKGLTTMGSIGPCELLLEEDTPDVPC
jgi:hypothetical protein